MIKKIVLKEWEKGGMFRICSRMSRLLQMGIWDNGEGAFHLWKYETERGTQLDQGQGEYSPASCKTCSWYMCLLVNHELVSRCFYLTATLLPAEGAGSILAQGSVFVLCRSTLLSFGARLSFLVRKMTFLLTKQLEQEILC